MVTLHLLQYLQNNSFGTIDQDLFFERIPLDKTGVAIISRGGEATYGRRRSVQRFDVYSRGLDDLLGYNMLDNIRTFFSDDYDDLCELPIVPGVSNRLYKKARITLMGNIENLGPDANDRILFRLSAQLIYEKGE